MTQHPPLTMFTSNDGKTRLQIRMQEDSLWMTNALKDLSSDYFDELLERIRDIRASERRFYQKITDIYATASDYNKNAPESQSFFATVQNKLHWAIHGHTAAELVKERANSELPNMGLKSWGGARVTNSEKIVHQSTLN